MSEPVSALLGAEAAGYVRVADAGPTGMVTIRGDLSDADFAGGVSKVLGLAVPEPLSLASDGESSLMWMSPDELLLVCPHEDAEAVARSLGRKMLGSHHLVVNVSDARAMITLTGEGAALREVLAKLTPADTRDSAFPVGRVRRSWLAQVAAAMWFLSDGEARVICFRSVAGYVFGLLKQSAEPGSEVG